MRGQQRDVDDDFDPKSPAETALDRDITNRTAPMIALFISSVLAC
jgi:hypothetical protein